MVTLKYILALILRNVHCAQIKFKYNFYISKSRSDMSINMFLDLNYTKYVINVF